MCIRKPPLFQYIVGQLKLNSSTRKNMRQKKIRKERKDLCHKKKGSLAIPKSLTNENKYTINSSFHTHQGVRRPAGVAAGARGRSGRGCGCGSGRGCGLGCPSWGQVQM